MGAQDSNLAVKLSQNTAFPGIAFLEENFPTKRQFLNRVKFRGIASSPVTMPPMNRTSG